MSGPAGMRERKKQQTRELISETATTLFLERGFDKVSMAEIAAAADVSKMTVFNYFASKEDLVLGQIENHVDEPATVVRACQPGQSLLDALHQHFVTKLAAGDPSAGLASDARFQAFRHLVLSTPSLKLRLMEQAMRSEDSLAIALAEAAGTDPGAISSVIAADLIITVQRALVVRNLERVDRGQTETAGLKAAIEEADRAFGLLGTGLGDLIAAPAR